MKLKNGKCLSVGVDGVTAITHRAHPQTLEPMYEVTYAHGGFLVSETVYQDELEK